MSEESAPSHLAAVVRQLRTEAGLSLYELAKRSGINRAKLARIESGEIRRPTQETINSLARALQTEPEVLYDSVWQDSDQPLPSAAIYFRSKYQLNEAQIRQLEASLREVTGEESHQDEERRSP